MNGCWRMKKNLIALIAVFSAGAALAVEWNGFRAPAKAAAEAEKGFLWLEAGFYYPVILGIDRAVDWIVAQPEVDPSRVHYEGKSQGGGFGFYLTALNRHFTRAVFFVPAQTDVLGACKGRQSGWPYPLEMHAAPLREVVARTAPYFDAANFASRIRCPVRVVVGFADMTCAPCAVYAAYNEIRAPEKEIIHAFGMGHKVTMDYYAEYGIWPWAR